MPVDPKTEKRVLGRDVTSILCYDCGEPLDRWVHESRAVSGDSFSTEGRSVPIHPDRITCHMAQQIRRTNQNIHQIIDRIERAQERLTQDRQEHKALTKKLYDLAAEYERRVGIAPKG